MNELCLQYSVLHIIYMRHSDLDHVAQAVEHDARNIKGRRNYIDQNIPRIITC